MRTEAGQAVGQVVIHLEHVGAVRVVTVAEAARRLNYSVRYIQILCSMDTLIAIKFSGVWWVLERSIELFAYPKDKSDSNDYNAANA